jgi:hypothetical protein
LKKRYSRYRANRYAPTRVVRRRTVEELFFEDDE